jgi:predicted PurR-regulated permease PerM
MRPRAERLGFLVVLVLGSALVLYRIRGVLTPFFIGVVIAYILNPLVDSLERRGAPRVAGIAIVYLLVLALLALVSVYLFPITIRQLETMTVDLPVQIRRIESLLTDLYSRFHRVPLPNQVRDALDSAVERWEGMLASAASEIIGGLVGMFYQLPNLVLGPILAFYFARDKDQILRKVMSWIPARGRAEASNLIGELDAVIGGFVRGQLLVAMIMAVMISVGLWLAGIEFAFLIGTAAGILDLIPYFGPLLGAIPALMVAVIKSPLHVFYVVAVFAVANQIETAVLSPRIVSGYVGLHPLAVIFSLLVGAYIWGLLGMIVAVPLAGILRVLLRYTWTRVVEQ